MRKITSLLLLMVLSGCMLAQSNPLFTKPVPLKQSNSITEKWDFLKTVLEDKRIVALGESLHGVKEYNDCKLELIQYLHEELGFNVLAIESDLAMNYFGNEFRDQIPDTLFLEKLFSPIWHTEEYLKLVKYIKDNPDLKIIGFDMNGRKSVRVVSDELRMIIDSTDQKYQAFFKKYPDFDDVNGTTKRYSKGHRDSTMADILQWIIDDVYPNEKIIISAANDHISRVEYYKACMGALLSQAYGEKYYSIGFFHSLGDPVHAWRDVFYKNEKSALPENSLQSELLKLKSENGFIDLKKWRRKKNNRWIDQEIRHVIMAGKYEYNIKLSASFDAIIWFKNVTHPKYVIDSNYHFRNKN